MALCIYLFFFLKISVLVYLLSKYMIAHLRTYSVYLHFLTHRLFTDTLYNPLPSQGRGLQVVCGNMFH